MNKFVVVTVPVNTLMTGATVGGKRAVDVKNMGKVLRASFGHHKLRSQLQLGIYDLQQRAEVKKILDRLDAELHATQQRYLHILQEHAQHDPQLKAQLTEALGEFQSTSIPTEVH
jgi:hypothetical protein